MILPRRKHPRRPRRRQALTRFEALESRRLLATYFVDSTADNDVGICAADNAAGNVACTIRSAVDAAEANPGNDTIQIPDGTYLTFIDIESSTAQDFSFVGNGADPSLVVIDAENVGRVVEIFADGVSVNASFQGLTIQNGRAQDGSGGGGINANGDVNLFLQDVVVQDNVAAENVFFPGDFSSGGGIQTSGNLTIVDSVIQNNSATIDGGGIEYSADDNSKILSITDSTIAGNTSSSVGGGIYVHGTQTTATIDNVTFTANEGPDSGGGVYSGGATISVTDSTFTGNLATAADSGGGGLYILGQGGTGNFMVTNSDFQDNEAVDGAGGLEVVNVAGTVDGGTYFNNTVTGAGNSFDQGGGAIVVIGNTSGAPPNVSIQGVTVQSNTAPAAGGIAVVDGNLTISDSLIENNSATNPLIGGGGIGAVSNVAGSSLTIERSRILGNSTTAEGAGIGAVDVSLTISETTIDGNSANGGRAGGIGLIGNAQTPVAMISSSTISNNLANTDGGGIALASAAVQLTNVTVTDNTAFGNGGGIAYDNNDGAVPSLIQFSTIADNSGLVGGNNLAAQGTATISVSDSIFAAGDCTIAPGTVASAGFNIDSGLTCGFNLPSDQNNTDPLLGPLQDNGGLVFTLELLAGSPAVDMASNNFPPTDARGVARPLDGDGNLVSTADIGAFEAAAVVAPTLTVSDVFFEESSGTATVLVTLNTDTGPFDVDFATVAGTAVAPDDFISTTGTLNFAGVAGEQQSIFVSLVDDDVAEQDEQFQVTLNNTTLGTVNITDTGIVSVFDDDTAILSVSDSAIDEDSGSIDVRVTLNGSTDAPFTVDVATLDLVDGAVAGTDYTTNSDTLTFVGFDGETQTFTVTLTPDSIAELDEAFAVEVSNISAGTRDIQFDNFADRVEISIAGTFAAGGISVNDVSLFTPDPFTTIAYVADASGLLVLDVSDPTAVVQLGSFALGDNAFQIDTVDVAFFSGVVYIAAGSAGLEVLDVSDPANITRLGSFSVAGQSAISLDRSGGTIYLGETDATGTAGGLRILDASDPANITQLSFYQTDIPEALDVRVDGSTAYVAASGSGLQVVDVSNPALPTTLGSFDSITARVVEIAETTAYIGTPSGLTILDVFDFAAITELGSFPTAAAVNGIDVDDENIDVVTLSDESGVVQVLRVEDPQNIDVLGSRMLVSSARRFDIEGLTAFVANGTDGIQILRGELIAEARATILNDDIATVSISDVAVNEDTGTIDFIASLSGDVDGVFTIDATTVALLDEATVGDDFTAKTQTLTFLGVDGETRTFSVDLGIDAVVEADELFAVNFDNLQAGGRNVQFDSTQLINVDISEIGSFDTPESSRGVHVIGSTAYVADGIGGLLVLDASDPTDILQLGSFDTTGLATRVQVVGSLAYVADDTDDLRILDVSDPARIFEVGFFDVPNRQASNLQVIGTTVYVTEVGPVIGDGGLRILDASDPANIVELGNFAFANSSTAEEVVVIGSTAYVATDGDGLVILDVTDPAGIVQLGAQPLAAGAVALDGTTAYVGTSSALEILDVSNPAAIVTLGSVATPVAVEEIELVGSTAYVALTTGFVRAFDVSDPTDIRQIGDFTTPAFAFGLQVRESTAYVAAHTAGLRVLDLDTTARANGTIVNDDSATLTVSDVTVSEDAGTATVTVTLDNSVQGGFLYDFTTNDGSATAPDDYQTTSGTLGTGSAGQFQLINIPIVPGPTIEGTESFTVSLSNVVPLGNAPASAIDASSIGTVTITEDPIADLTITQTDNPDPVTAGDPLTYTLQVTNNGPSGATGVQVTDTLPADVIFVSGDVDGNAGLVSESGGVVTADIGNLALGASAFVTINVNVAAAATGVLSNTATVAGNQIDSNLANNDSTETTTIAAANTVDLTTSIADDIDPVDPGASVTFVVSIANNGPDIANNVVSTTTLPTGFSVVSATAALGGVSVIGTTTVVGNVVTGDFTAIALGDTAAVTITATAASSAGTFVTNTTITSDELDNNAGNNVASETTTVNAIIDLQLTGDGSDPRPNAGDVYTETFNVINLSAADAATNVIATFDLDPDTVFQNGSSTAGIVGINGTQITVAIANLAPGASDTITLDLMVGNNVVGGTSLTTSGNVTSDQADPAVGNNSADEFATVAISAVDDTLDIDEDEVDNVARTINLTGNDNSLNALTIDAVSVGSLGTAVILPGSQSVIYTPFADAFGQDVLTYTISDSVGATAIGNLTVNIASINDPPIADDDVIDAANRQTTIIDVATLLLGDTPGPANEGQTLTVTDVTTPSTAGGLVELVGTNILYTPLESFTGLVDTFQYTISDGIDTDTATVTVNLPPRSVDLVTSIVDDVDPVLQGGTVTYTITITNQGPDIASNVVSTTTLPAGFTIVTADISPLGSVIIVGDTVTADLAALDSGSTTTLTIISTAGNVSGAFTTSTNVAADETDSDSANNSADELTDVVEPGTVTGHIFCDANNNGTSENLEIVVGGTVFLDFNGNRIADLGEPSTITDNSGNYIFNGVVNQTFTVVAMLPANCTTIPTQPGVVRTGLVGGNLARSIASADIDDDGDRDLLVAHDESGDLRVYRNDGGEFTLDRRIELGDRLQSVFAFESPELATPVIAVAGIGNPSTGGEIYHSNSIFTADDFSTVMAGNGPIEVVIDNFDGNNIPDIVTVSFRSSNLQLFLNGSSEAVTIATARLARTVDAGDVNNDGHSDIVVGGYGYPGDESSQLAVLLGDGMGGFSDPVEANPISKLVSVKVAPLDTSGNNRVLALSAQGRLNVYSLENGELFEVDSVEIDPGATAFDFGDFNRDGLVDVAIVDAGDQLINLLVGNGFGQFAHFTTIHNILAPSDLVVDDFDGNGMDDIAVSNLYQELSVGPTGIVQARLPSTTTILRLGVSERTVGQFSGTTQVDFRFRAADPATVFDVSGDGLVTAIDALQVINRLSRISAEGDQQNAGDVNGDGVTSAVDALMIINYLAKNDNNEAAGIDQLIAEDDDEDEEDRFAAVDVVLTHLLN